VKIGQHLPASSSSWPSPTSKIRFWEWATHKSELAPLLLTLYHWTESSLWAFAPTSSLWPQGVLYEHALRNLWVKVNGMRGIYSACDSLWWWHVCFKNYSTILLFWIYVCFKNYATVLVFWIYVQIHSNHEPTNHILNLWSPSHQFVLFDEFYLC
jgi:hypothetical protein